MSFDMWLHELVNLGVLVSTGTALDRQIHKALKSACIESTVTVQSAAPLERLVHCTS